MVLGRLMRLKSRLTGRAGGATAPAIGWITEPVTLKIDVTVPAGASTTQGIPASFVVDPKIGSVKEYQLTLNEFWVLNDVYVTAEQGVDGTLVIKKNGVDIIKVKNVNSLLVSNPSRPRPLTLAPVRFSPGDRVAFEFIPASSPGADTAVTVYTAGVKHTKPVTP